jgi:hypothetical protein
MMHQLLLAKRHLIFSMYVRELGEVHLMGYNCSYFSGDFAILIASGVSFVRALLLNVLVSLTSLIGLYVGLAISDDETVKQWIVAVAAGLFIYISLVDMVILQLYFITV